VPETPRSKRCVDDLAIFGGSPSFAGPLHVGAPNLGDRQRLLARINEALDRNRLTNDGPFVQELEHRIAGRLGVAHCVAMCNGTVALQIAVRACELRGEIIVPSFTFVATPHALRWLGLTPVFCDVDPVTHNIDPSQVQALITPETSAIIGVHVWGRPCDTKRLSAIADHHGLGLLFDAAHAFGCSSLGRMVGGFGDAEVFSFHATKLANSFEGGAVVTNSGELASRLRLMRNFGFADYDQVVSIGINGKMSEVAAAMGLTSLDSLDHSIEINRQNYAQYLEHLRGVPGVSAVRFDDREACNYQYVVVEIDNAAFGCTRDEVQRVLWAENILARRYFYPGCHRVEPYRSDARVSRQLPATESLCERVLCLPTGATVSAEAVEIICQIIRLVATAPKAVSKRRHTLACSERQSGK
jgi:dTDP-4-amino-4,6-dideoxygalactose transaminase